MSFRKWLIFDLGQVLVRFDTQKVIRSFEPYSPLSHQQLSNVIVHSPLVDRFEKGLLGKTEFIQALIKAAQLDPKAFNDHYQFLYTDIFTPLEGTLRRVKQLHQQNKYGIALLSNTNDLHYDLIRQRWPEVFKYFHRLFLSMRIGVRKPDERVFRYVQEQLKVPPQHIRYWDDMPGNIDAARRCGWKAGLFRDLRDLRRT